MDFACSYPKLYTLSSSILSCTSNALCVLHYRPENPLGLRLLALKSFATGSEVTVCARVSRVSSHDHAVCVACPVTTFQVYRNHLSLSSRVLTTPTMVKSVTKEVPASDSESDQPRSAKKSASAAKNASNNKGHEEEEAAASGSGSGDEDEEEYEIEKILDARPGAFEGVRGTLHS